MIWAGTEVGIMESLDNGETWHYLESGLPTVDIFQMFTQDNQVVLSTYGRGIWTWQYGPELEPDAVTDFIVTENLFELYPNPTKGLVNVRFSENINPDKVSVEVYSTNGKVVYRHSPGRMSTGNVMQVDLSGYQEGIYIMNIRAEDKQYSERIILQ